MIELPTGLANFMKGTDLAGLKPFALLFRNKWVEEESGESGDNGGHYELDDTPIDISAHIVKPNTLSMTLDVNEVAQYNANNVTLTLSDTKNYFVEGTPNSYFPSGYQLYGSRVVLYYGTDSTNLTSLFTGVIKDLPTYKPEQYQVDLKLVSPLEMLKDIEAKDFSDKVTGEELNFLHTEDQNKVYETSGTGVGGFDAVYADGTKLFEGLDYEIDQLNQLGIPALVTIINEDYHNATITADYYTWKTGLTVEQIVAGLVGLAGYDSGTEDIRNVIWSNLVRTQRSLSADFTLGYKQVGLNFQNTGNVAFSGDLLAPNAKVFRYSQLPTNFQLELVPLFDRSTRLNYFIGDMQSGNAYNGIMLSFYRMLGFAWGYYIYSISNGAQTQLASGENPGNPKIIKNGATVTVICGSSTVSVPVNFTGTGEYNEFIESGLNLAQHAFSTTILTDLDSGLSISDNGIVSTPLQKIAPTDVWVALQGTFEPADARYMASFRTSQDGTTWSAQQGISIGSSIGTNEEYIQFIIVTEQAQNANFKNAQCDVLTNELSLQLVNLSGLTVLEALQDFALISGYEFGVDRNGVFFFKPRVASTTPTYILGHDENVKVDTIKKNLSDFFTKLTLTFAQVPLEFYANTGERPTLVDRYGIINKEIDKPDIVNYDNPELAQAIGPQLIDVYSSLPNIIQVTGKLNLALELGDIVSLRRNMNLISPIDASDYSKFANQNTFYIACKITGMNYNFAKRQITYTLRDVSNMNNSPIEGAELWEFVYDLPINLGAK